MLRHKLSKSPEGQSIFMLHSQWQYSGNAYRRISQLPSHIIKTLDDRNVPEIIKSLDNASVDYLCDKSSCFDVLKGLLESLMNFESRRGQDDSSLEEEQNKLAASFYKHGGVNVLIRLLMMTSMFPQFTKGRKESEEMLRIKALILDVLAKMTACPVGEKITRTLMDEEDVLNYLFTLLAYQKTFVNACQLVEDMLQCKRIVLDLHSISNIRSLILCLNDDQLGNFCRILAVAISDLDIYENKSSLFAQNKQKRTRGFVNVRDINQGCHCHLMHLDARKAAYKLEGECLKYQVGILPDNVLHAGRVDVFHLVSQLKDPITGRYKFHLCQVSFLSTWITLFSRLRPGILAHLLAYQLARLQDQASHELLLGIPELLPRLVHLAVAREYWVVLADTPRFRGMVSELDCWMEWIENQMDEELYDVPQMDEFDDFVGGITIPTTAGAPMVVQQGLKITEQLIQKVEVVYVLGLFLLGKHRKKVQRKLAELKLAPGLSDLFDQFIWKCQVGRYSSRHRLRGHNAACECSPEVALKIQFLRLVHSFCDHSDYKHLLLSKNELNEVKRINSKAGNLALPNLDSVNKTLMCRGSKGLLTKIVEVMKKEPTTSTFRFWLARAVESYLRGSTSYCDQIFLMRRGLLQHVATNIVEHEIRHKEILQSSFDLLGELIKFNIEAFKTFDSIFTTPQKFEKFISTVNRNLVDSNMFIRSLVLSLEHFQTELDEFDLQKQGSKLLNYIADFSQQLDYLYRLITIIDVHNLTQENVSCLNTTLVFLMFANRKNKLPLYLQALKDDKEVMFDVSGSASFMSNFRDLLIFWQDHYLHKDKDCSALEKSSRISFDYWKDTVSILVAEEHNTPTAIIHYTSRLPCERTN